MNPKQLFDIAVLAGEAALVAGLIGIGVGLWGYEAHCPAGVGIGGCALEGGEVFGLLYASSQMNAGWLVGGIFAAGAAIVGALVKIR
jgi:hypothetical protein